MGVRSDVFLCFKNLPHDDMPERFKKMLKEGYGARVRLHPEGTAYAIEDVKWYFEEYSELRELYAYLNTVDDSDYSIIEACHDYPEHTAGDRGCWDDNPWGARRVVSVSIEYDTSHAY